MWPYSHPLRRPDVIDGKLAEIEADFRHESRMQDIRGFDVEEWVADVAWGSGGRHPSVGYSNLSMMDGSELVERVAVGDLQEGAGKHYETDGFDMDTFMEASHDIQADGFEPGAAITDAGTFEEVGQEQRPADVDAEADRVYEWIVAATDTDGLLDGEILFIGEGAVVRPQVAPSELLVRYPKGVARYEFGLPTCPYCGDERSSRNDVLQCIVVNHDADMSRWSEV